MTEASSLFGGRTRDQFLEQYWQKRPLLVRGALSEPHGMIRREELFTLAGRSECRARVIAAPRAKASWKLEHGPFTHAKLEGLAADGWTLLVQEVDRHDEKCGGLLERFRFVPNWRLDDLMVSYATDGGGVGPHIDRYDVFLIQTHGGRRWRIASTPLTEVRLTPGVELPLLDNFEPDQEWLLEPGDMLYLPPLIAHEGVAVGECITCSVGFRTPDPRELCASFIPRLSPDELDRMRYTDPGLRVPERLGEIPEQAREQLRRKARGLFAEDGAFDRWIGCFVTRPLREFEPVGTTGLKTIVELAHHLGQGMTLRRSAPSHFAWFRDRDENVWLFVGGEDYPLGANGAEVAELLCGRRSLDDDALLPHLEQGPVGGILIDLMLRGYLLPARRRPR